jgi:hypothetical protein
LKPSTRNSKCKNLKLKLTYSINGEEMAIPQKIHDSLLKELVKVDEKGKYLNLMELVKVGKFTTKCSVDLKNGQGCVDVVLTYPHSQNLYLNETKNGGLIAGVFAEGRSPIAFELITDVDFDVGKKLEQVNRYKEEYADVRVIIPEEYEKEYAQLFTINGVRVHTWKGIRRWKCKKCENIREVQDSSMQPYQCGIDSCSCNQSNFVGLKDVSFK